MIPPIRMLCTGSLIATSLLFISRPCNAQGWDDVGFWAADYTLNVLQNQAAGKLVDEYAEVYEILRDGYFVVRSLVDDNHSLHKEFFDELSSVNPIVENYYKVGEIINIYSKEFKAVKQDLPRIIAALKQLNVYTPDELKTMESVFVGMVERATDSVDELILVAIPGEGGLDMMDSERIIVIDRIHEESLAIVQDFRRFRTLIIQLASNRNPQGTQEIFKLYEIRP